MWDYFLEETLSSGEKVTARFDTKEEMEEYKKNKECQKKNDMVAEILKLIKTDKNINDTFKRGIK